MALAGALPGALSVRVQTITERAGSPPAEQAAATPADRGCPIGLTVLLAVAFLAVLTLIFATIDPCAQGPA
jgi:hypothetical protein